MIWNMDLDGIRLNLLAVGDSTDRDHFDILRGDYEFMRYPEYLPVYLMQQKNNEAAGRAQECARSGHCIPSFEAIASIMSRQGNFDWLVDSLGGQFPGIASGVRGRPLMSMTYQLDVNLSLPKKTLSTFSTPDAWLTLSSNDTNFCAPNGVEKYTATYYLGDSIINGPTFDTITTKNQKMIIAQIRENNKVLFAFDSVRISKKSGLTSLARAIITRRKAPSFDSDSLSTVAYAPLGNVRVTSPSIAIISHKAKGANLDLAVHAVLSTSHGDDTIPMSRVDSGQYIATWSGYDRNGWFDAKILHGDTTVDAVSFLVDGVKNDDYGDCTTPGLFDETGWVRGRSEYSGDVDCFVDTLTTADSGYVRLTNVQGGTPIVRIINALGVERELSSLSSHQTRGGYRVYRIPTDWVGQILHFQVVGSNTKISSWHLGVGPLTRGEKSEHIARIQSLDYSSGIANYTNLALRIENTSLDTLRNFRLRWFFSTEYFKEPTIGDWWSAFCIPRLVRLGVTTWAVELDYSGVKLAPESSLQINPDNSIGVFYPDWSSWNKNNDWSWLAGSSFQDNDRVVLLDSMGNRLQGEAPDSIEVSVPQIRKDSVNVLTRDEKWTDAMWSAPGFRIENYGDSLSDFKVVYYFREINPIDMPAKWQGPCVVSLDTLGNGLYRMTLDYTGITLAPERANVWVGDALVGLHRTDWGNWTKSDDPSISIGSTMESNSRVEVYNRSGTRIYGNVGSIQ